MKGTQLFIQALLAEQVSTLFAYPGGYALDLFDALYDQEAIRIVLPRHEQGLVHAADGYARATGKPGVCLVTSGPGATNLVTGIATANYDSVPLVCLTGQVPLPLIGNDAFQEVDIIGITRSVCKYGVMVRDRRDLGRILKEAFYIAATGRPGPVVVDLPQDILLQEADDSYPSAVSIRGYKPMTGVHAGQLKKAAQLLSQSERPLLLAGGGVKIAGAELPLRQLAETLQIPVVATLMGRGALDTGHPLYIGGLGMHGNEAANRAVSQCDVLLSIGVRFNDRITGKISEFAPHARIIHIDIDTASISRNIRVDIPIVADANTAIQALLPLVRPRCTAGWIDETAKRPVRSDPPTTLSPWVILDALNRRFPSALFVTDVGQHQMWAAAYLHLNRERRLLTSGGLGTMGFGLPAAIGAKLGCPDSPVICICGDGGLQMTVQELATAVSYELPILICVFNNQSLGMVRQNQTLFYHRRYAATCIRRGTGCPARCDGPSAACPPYTPDFIKLAESYGAMGIRITAPEEIEPAFAQAQAQTKKPVLLEFLIDCEELVFPMVRSGHALSDMITEKEVIQ